MYGDGEFRADRAYPYVAFVNNCTQMLALYCLVLLYHATYAELAPIRPLSKFIVIKVRMSGTWGVLGWCLRVPGSCWELVLLEHSNTPFRH